MPVKSDIMIVTEKRTLALILTLFVLLGLSYAIVTPVFEASDELWHYPMIQYLADGNPLPVQVFDPAQAGPWKQEASQPPLYYYLGAALTFWIDTSDMSQIRWLNPHVDNGLITADGNINLAIHDPAANPWQGTLLAVRIVRVFSVFLGVATVYLTYRIGKELAPNRPEIALGATAVNAFMPMFLFISGAVNNDNLAIPLASLAIFLMIRFVKVEGRSHRAERIRNSRFTIHYSLLLLGIVIGLGLLTKEGTIGLLPLAWGTAFVARWRAGGTGEQGSKEAGGQTSAFRLLLSSLTHSLFDFALILLPVLAIAGWWYWRNVVLYGDWLGWSAFIAVLGSRAQPASLAQLWDERWGFLLSYWGLFGGVNVPMWTWIYHFLNGVLAAGVFGFVIYAFKQINDLRLMIKGVGFNLQSLIINLLDFVVSRFALVVCLLFTGAVVYGLVQWATTTWSSQGRLVFTAVSALNILLITGLVGWLPQKPARWIVAGLGLFMFIIAAIAPWIWIRPAYEPETYQPAHEVFMMQPRQIDFGGKMRLAGFSVEPEILGTTAVQPGQWVDLILQWEVLAPMDRDWSVFVHLNDPVLGVPIAQRDMYTGQGLRPTSLLKPGETIENYYRLFIPETAVSPAQLELTVGLYDFNTYERLKLENGNDAATLALLQLEPVPGEYPNATAVNFMNELKLVGYELEPRRINAGETVVLRLYVQALRPLTTDYTFFAQVLDADTTRWASLDLGQPTSTWSPGETQIVEMPLAIAADASANVYPLILGIYTRTEDGGFQRLQLVTGDGRITQDDVLTLTKIRVD
ncbi:MAG: glycosyltransferase family 39 protein [Ardenticatenaceae bacterium]|nr:glycosyltransferase family 39 protein [Ardenticatenaceae bacterium]